MQCFFKSPHIVKNRIILFLRDLRRSVQRKFQRCCLFQLENPPENHVNTLIKRSDLLMKFPGICVQKIPVVGQLCQFSVCGIVNVLFLKVQICTDTVNDLFFIGLMTVQ